MKTSHLSDHYFVYTASSVAQFCLGSQRSLYLQLLRSSLEQRVIIGSYRNLLHDGRAQTVNFKTDSFGYVADVKYDGNAEYSEYKLAPAYKTPAYLPPRY